MLSKRIVITKFLIRAFPAGIWTADLCVESQAYYHSATTTLIHNPSLTQYEIWDINEMINNQLQYSV